MTPGSPLPSDAVAGNHVLLHPRARQKPENPNTSANSIEPVTGGCVADDRILENAEGLATGDMRAARMRRVW